VYGALYKSFSRITLLSVYTELLLHRIIYTADAQTLFLHVSTLHGCHHHGVFTAITIVHLLNTEHTHTLPGLYPQWAFVMAPATIANHLVKTAVPPVTAYMERVAIPLLSLNTNILWVVSTVF